MSMHQRFFQVLAGLITTLALSGLAMADSAEEAKKAEMAEMQRMLNAEVMAKPFAVEEMAQIETYIAEAMKKNLVPEPYKGQQTWRSGMTCAHLRGYRARRDCRYYYRFHGSYYPYGY